MKNIFLATTGGGSYDENTFYDQIIESGVTQDWWILSDNWDALMDGLRAIEFNINASRAKVAGLINYTPRDLPCNEGTRFPYLRNGTSTILKFYRIPSHIKAALNRLCCVANRGRSRDVGLARRGRGNLPNPDIIRRHQENLREDSLSYAQTLNEIQDAVLSFHTRTSFENQFGLVWTPIPAAAPTT